MTYDSELGESNKSSDNATDTDEEARKSGCRDLIIIDNLNNSKSNIKEDTPQEATKKIPLIKGKNIP